MLFGQQFKKPGNCIDDGFFYTRRMLENEDLHDVPSGGDNAIVITFPNPLPSISYCANEFRGPE